MKKETNIFINFFVSGIVLLSIIVLILLMSINKNGTKQKELDNIAYSNATIDNFLSIDYLKEPLYFDVFNEEDKLNYSYRDYDKNIFKLMLEGKYEEVEKENIDNSYKIYFDQKLGFYVSFNPQNHIFEVYNYEQGEDYLTSSQKRYYKIDDKTSSMINEYIISIVENEKPSFSYN